MARLLEVDVVRQEFSAALELFAARHFAEAELYYGAARRRLHRISVDGANAAQIVDLLDFEDRVRTVLGVQSSPP